MTPSPDSRRDPRLSVSPEDRSFFLDRDLSLVAFQRRVLDEALDENNPLLERLKFIGILGANIDEFIMVREAELTAAHAADSVRFESPEASPSARLDRIREHTRSLMRDARQCLHERLIPALASKGIHILSYSDLELEERQEVGAVFEASILPLLMPLGFDATRPFPHIGNRGTTFAVMLRDQRHAAHVACVRVPDSVGPFVPFHWRRKGSRGLAAIEQGLVWADEVVAAGLPSAFPGMQIEGAYPFRIVRNAGIEMNQADEQSLPDAIQDGVDRRQFAEIVALVVAEQMPPSLTNVLVENLRVAPAAVHRTPAPRDYGRLMEVSRIDRPDLHYPAYTPRLPLGLASGEDIFQAVSQRDVLLHHPFDSFEAVIDLFEQAARDPAVVSISMTLYRLPRHSRIAKALLEARKNGKAVRVVVELRARFDEENNIAAARALERAGAHVVYGVANLKVHGKIALIVRNEPNGIRRYVHVSSGNYNAQTAKVYTDLGLLTCDDEIARDATDLFNLLTGHGDPPAFRKLLVAPAFLRDRIRQLIDDEIDCHRRHGSGRLILKMNALTDPEVIETLYRASRAGVQIDLIVRGMCCLRPGVPGLSETIRVRSIVDRFLEHGRVWYFRNGGRERIYIGSADCMPRNLDRRVEVMIPVEDETLKRRVRDDILAHYLADDVKARQLMSDGSYTRVARTGAGSVSSQSHFVSQTAADQSIRRPAEDRPVKDPSGAPIAAAAATAEKLAEKKQKQKKKDRQLWVTFGSRIAAQIVGAIATVFLGLYLVDKYREPRRDANQTPIVGQEQPVPVRAVLPSTGEPTLAVLPLKNFSGDPQQEYFADGMTEALIADLAQVKGLRVISRTSSMHYKGQTRALPEIAQELGADLIVEGSVARVGDHVRITAQLIDAKRDQHIWARTYDKTLRDLLSLQADVAAAIAKEVKGALTPAPQSLMAVRGLVDPQVYDLYLRGRYAWNQRTAAGFQDAIRYFDQAIQKDPDFALAYAGLADAYQLLGPGLETRGAPTKAKAAAERALRLDDGLAEAHTSLAGLLHRTDVDIEGAEREFRRALDLNPGYATSHQWYAILLAEEGRDEEATRHAQQAVALDPLSGPIHQTLGLVHYYGRRYDRAVVEARRALELVPSLTLARDILGRSLVAQGSPEAAIQVYEQGPSPQSADAMGTLGLAHLRAGHRARADAIVKDLLARRPRPAGALAKWYAATGDRSQALAMLEELFAQRPASLQSLKADPALDPLRSEPRFADLFRRAKQGSPARRL